MLGLWLQLWLVSRLWLRLVSVMVRMSLESGFGLG